MQLGWLTDELGGTRDQCLSRSSLIRFGITLMEDTLLGLLRLELATFCSSRDPSWQVGDVELERNQEAVLKLAGLG